MKNILFLLIFVSFHAPCSEPRPCDAGESDIKNMLVLLAKAAKEYYEENGELPRTSWTHEMEKIIYSVPDSKSFGNIDSAGDGHRIEMICSESKGEGKYTHHFYYIDMRTNHISNRLIKEIRGQ